METTSFQALNFAQSCFALLYASLRSLIPQIHFLVDVVNCYFCYEVIINSSCYRIYITELAHAVFCRQNEDLNTYAVNSDVV